MFISTSRRPPSNLAVLLAFATFKDLREGCAAEIGQPQPGAGLRFLDANGAAVDGAKKIIEEPLSGGRVVENLAYKRRLRRLFNEITQPSGSGIEAFQEKRIYGCVAGHQLRRMEVPSLVVAVYERVTYVIKVKLPGMMNGGAGFFHLACRQRSTGLRGAVRRYRKNVRCAIGEPDAGACKRHLHYLPREVAGGMGHVLICGSDVASGGVVIGPEVCGDAAPATRGHQGQQIHFPALVKDRLGRLNHQLEP